MSKRCVYVARFGHFADARRLQKKLKADGFKTKLRRTKSVVEVQTCGKRKR